MAKKNHLPVVIFLQILPFAQIKNPEIKKSYLNPNIRKIAIQLGLFCHNRKRGFWIQLFFCAPFQARNPSWDQHSTNYVLTPTNWFTFPNNKKVGFACKQVNKTKQDETKQNTIEIHQNSLIHFLSVYALFPFCILWFIMQSIQLHQNI